MVYGPVTEKQNLTEGFFLTDLIAGDEIIIQLLEPANSKETSNLSISRVVHAYKNMFPFDPMSSQRAATLTCYYDVACYSAWMSESDAVALVLLSDGTSWCTGSLLNNTAQNFRPFFLTAFHCIDTERLPNGCSDGVLSNTEISNAENWMFRFQYKKTTCSGNITSTVIDYNQANFRAAWRDTDFALMELRTNINNERITFLGWDRNDVISSTGTNIHHPAGEPMKISFDIHSLNRNSSISWDDCTTSAINTHWSVHYDTGAFERGSSGSPLFNTDKLVIGQLHGGSIQCPPTTGYFGQLRLSWTGGITNATRLSNWLYSLGLGPAATTTNTVRFPPIVGPDVVASTCLATYSISGLPSSGVANQVWTITGGLRYLNGYGTNSCNVERNPLNNLEFATVQFTCTIHGQPFSTERTVTARIIPKIATGIYDSATNQAVPLQKLENRTIFNPIYGL